MIIVHHLNNSRSQRVLWMLEELGVAYDIKHYQRDKATMLAPPELREVHPLGKSPVITDGAHTIAESGAILEYLVRTYGKGGWRPAEGTPEHLRYTYWMHYAEGSLMPLLVLKLIFDTMERGKRMPWLVRPIGSGIARAAKDLLVFRQMRDHMGFVEKSLAEACGPWFAGDTISAADVQMSFPLEAAAARVEAMHVYPRIGAWLQAVHARPAYQQALSRGGPLKLA